MLSLVRDGGGFFCLFCVTAQIRARKVVLCSGMLSDANSSNYSRYKFLNDSFFFVFFCSMKTKSVLNICKNTGGGDTREICGGKKYIRTVNYSKLYMKMQWKEIWLSPGLPKAVL